MSALMRLKRGVNNAYRYLERLAHNLVHRLLNEPGYADAAADLAYCAVVFCCRDPRILRGAHTLLAMLRNLVQVRPPSEDDAWELAWT